MFSYPSNDEITLDILNYCSLTDRQTFLDSNLTVELRAFVNTKNDSINNRINKM